MKIFIGADHRGFKLKEFLKDQLQKNFLIEDCGNLVYDPEDDYVDFALRVGEKVIANQGIGILICGSGAGVCFTVNKIKGIRAALAINPVMAQKLKEDDDVNVLCLASDFTDFNTALQIVESFFSASFKNEKKYLRRIQKVIEYENKSKS